MWKKIGSSWVLGLPLVVFGLGVALVQQTENAVRAQFHKAQEHWRAGRYPEAIRAYRLVYESYPESSLAMQALWESATLNYLSSYDLDVAVGQFEAILAQSPTHPLADRARAMLAEIHESALQDPSRALEYWQALNRPGVDAGLRRQALYRSGRALFELSRFGEARDALERVSASEPRDYLTQQADLRMGIMLQLQEQYELSLPHFLAVLSIEDCADCRLQAQLGLIESYEFLDDLDSALRIAHQLDGEDYPRKQELLARLKQKQRLYRSSSWIN